MPKRKRSVEDAVHNKLEKHRIAIFRAISSAKAAERKRFSARLREPGLTSQKKARLEREHNLLKSLDLRQVARNHLHSNLLRIKAVEASPDLPAELRAGQPKSTLSPEEITLHNNVISQLCNTPVARQALDRAVADVCETLGVRVAEKSKKARKNKRKDAEDQPSDRMASPGSSAEEEDDDDADNEEEPAASKNSKTKTKTKSAPPPREEDDGSDDDASEFEGFSSDGEDAEGQHSGGNFNGLDGSDEEGAISKYDNLLGGSSDDEEDEFDEEFLAKYKGREQVNLDDISLSGSTYGSDSEDEEEDEEGEEEESDAQSASASPPPKKVKNAAKSSGDKEKEFIKPTKAQEKEAKAAAKAKKAAKAAVKASKTGNSAFLPTLMGGYISGSESASDIDAPPKKSRRGQRARQAIWEKKYGASAKHLQKAAAKGGRDSGWDMKRGAVDSGDRSKGKWNKGGRGGGGGGGGGGRGPPSRDSRNTQGREVAERSRPAPKPTKKDDEGPLHPSWAARKKAKEAEKSVAFAGSKITFD
ncbi:BUD22 family protein [Escovopsis weberi]|uniref:BUD22 family protein n=1 Tax=Escovopsis weberi TaxID=150374 RepID=A0A0M9VUM3_ESCWE|nr:BUD22 family protein [Escovopsis weberi]